MASKKQRIAGWIVSGIITLFLIGPSAAGKFVEWQGKEEAFGKMGFTTDVMFKIGVLEVVIALLYFIPRTSFIGAILVTGYLGGATVTHVRVGEPFIVPVIIGVVAWIGCGLRRPEIFSLACGSQSTACGSQSTGI